ncbi:MAG: nitroreductase [Bacilli bacterium]|nr:nitroreductase [Bacilli bacterium]
MHDFKEAMKLRHSVRNYKDDPIEEKQAELLNAYIKEINLVSGLDISLHLNEDIFSKWILGYGFIKNCRNYLSFSGKEDMENLDEKVGYYGELVILYAQELGLNTCWVGGTFRKKDALKQNGDYRLVLVAAVGKGVTNGTPSKSKAIDSYYEGENVPSWFLKGMEAVLLSPSAVNQKKWKFVYRGGEKVEAKGNGRHFNEVDIGIAKLHFELGAEKKVFPFPMVEPKGSL